MIGEVKKIRIIGMDLQSFGNHWQTVVALVKVRFDRSYSHSAGAAYAADAVD